MSCKECDNKDRCINTFNSLHECDILFIQDCYKTETGINGYKSENLKELKRLFRLVLLDKSYQLINLVNKKYPEGRKPLKSDIKSCQELVKASIERCKPKFIIPMGSLVFNVLVGKSKFTSWVGRNIKHKEYNIIPIFHPDYAEKSKQRQREYSTQIQNAVKQIMGAIEDISKNNYVLVTEESKIIITLKNLINQYKNTPQAFDYETTGLIPAKGLPVCISISHRANQGYCLYFFDIDEFRNTGKNSKLTPAIKKAVKEWMESDIPKIAQNAKFEIKWTMEHFDCEPNNLFWDTKQVAHLLDENAQRKLSDMAYQYTDMGGYDIPMQEFLDGGNVHWEAQPQFMLPYSAGDSDCTFRIYEKQLTLIQNSTTSPTWLYKNVILPGIYTLARIEQRGMCLDLNTMMEVELKLNEMIENIEDGLTEYKEVRQTLNHINRDKGDSKKLKNINLNSTVQVQYLLYKACKLPVLNTTKTGNPSTDEDTLKSLQDKHPVVKDIVRLRSYSYQLSDLETIINKMIGNTVFSDLLQDYVVTGRLSSRNPNLQNIKGGSEEDPSLIKECFVSRFYNGKLVQADYSQLELRLVGSESGEPKFITAFKNKVDMHSLTGSEVFNIDLEEFQEHKDTKYKAMRTDAKRINFGSVYGITEYGLSKQMGCTEKEAKTKLDAYWKSYPHIAKWDQDNKHIVTKELEISSTLGRIRHLPDAVNTNKWKRASALRQASNFKIQSLGADITMWSMTQVDNELIKRKMKSMVIGQIHDSVIIDSHPSETEVICKILYEVMEVRANKIFSFLKIPLKVDIETGTKWSNLKKR